jgi:SulP family sulfate permease
MAVLSLMTASALTPLAPPGSSQYIAAAMLLAALSGFFLFAMGLLRLGALANLLSRPVVNGFVGATAVLIIIGQISSLLGVHTKEGTALQQLIDTLRDLPQAAPYTAGMGLAALLLLFAARFWGWNRSCPWLAPYPPVYRHFACPPSTGTPPIS